MAGDKSLSRLVDIKLTRDRIMKDIFNFFADNDIQIKYDISAFHEIDLIMFDIYELLFFFIEMKYQCWML